MGELGRKFLHKLPDMEILRNLESPFILWIQIDIYFLASTTYVPIRLSQVPEIDVEIVESGHHPSGVGEPSSTVVGPAVANAIFNAVGARVRQMPITREAVLSALTVT